MDNRLRELREERGLSLRELGKSVGMSAAVLGNYERGDREPKIAAWQELADFFDVSPSYIMGISNEKNELNDLLKNKINNMLDFKNLDSNEEQQTSIFLNFLIQEITKYINILLSNNDRDFQLQSIVGLTDFIKLMSAMNEESQYEKVQDLSNHLSFLKDLYTGNIFYSHDGNGALSLQNVEETTRIYLSNKLASNQLLDGIYLDYFKRYYN